MKSQKFTLFAAACRDVTGSCLLTAYTRVIYLNLNVSQKHHV